MNLLKSFTGVDLSNIITTIVKEVSSKFPTPMTPEQQLQMEKELMDFFSSEDMAQTEINKVEAASPKTFVAGWRPALGWTCDIAIFLYFIPRFILGMYFWATQVIATGNLLPMPEMGIGDVLGLVATLLGTAGLRTYEKVKGVNNNH